MRKVIASLICAAAMLATPAPAHADPAMTAEIKSVGCKRSGDTRVTIQIHSPKRGHRVATFYWQTDHSGFGLGSTDVYAGSNNKFSLTAPAGDVTKIQVYRGFTIQNPILDTEVAALDCD